MLAFAQQCDRVLRALPLPSAPGGFERRVLARVRRARWRSEQLVDWGFNAALAAAAVFLVGGVWMLLNISGLAVVAGETVGVLTQSLYAASQEVRPHVATYAAAVGLLMATLAIWWWADSRV
jgi:hypothetical protein